MRLKELSKISTMDELIRLRDSLNSTDRQKEIFMLRFNRGFSIIQISIECNMSESTVYRELRKIGNKIAKLCKRTDENLVLFLFILPMDQE